MILFLVFRRLSDIGLPFLVLGLGSVWMIGTMGFAGIPFTMVFVALVPIILGIGIDYTIHILNRYYEESKKGLTAKKSAVRSVNTVGVAISLTAITTIIGFGSFSISDLPPIQNFGFLAGSGVFFIFVLTTTLLPSLLILRDREGEKKKQKGGLGKGQVVKILSKIEKGVQHHKRSVLIGAGIITVLSMISATGLTTTMSFDTFLTEDADSVATMEKVEDQFGKQTMTNFVLAEGEIKTPESLWHIYSLENSIKSDPRNEDLITDTKSLAELIWRSTGGNIPSTKAEIEVVVKKLKNEQPELLNMFLIGNNKSVIYFSINSETDKKMKEATDIIRSHVENYANRPDMPLNLTIDGGPAVGGGPAIISDILGSILPNMRNSILLAIILVAAVLALVFKSALLGLIGASPVILAFLWEFGVLKALGWPLDVMNMMVSALAIGIGVDFAIHVTHRFQEEWKVNGKSPEESISITIRNVGEAITAAAATTIGVFVVLSLSRMPPVARFGGLSAIVIFFSLLGALIVLPSALLAYAKLNE
ncbi:hypothetical protein AKJ43_00180 [candidate division MSBL1 archaeon SCGC-AAA261D19]|uniref:SSD domain-containing protein n=1 Tax=candidate division MSBL1 archaeon SCGC-AAA261D19 TaxID=1698273 RepID=A0A133V8R7_9EURY|nr:hypothetical protein AKJ43_00180 [candidate division MSBL1 archaeon SCGC-AAA261D19]